MVGLNRKTTKQRLTIMEVFVHNWEINNKNCNISIRSEFCQGVSKENFYPATWVSCSIIEKFGLEAQKNYSDHGYKLELWMDLAEETM